MLFTTLLKHLGYQDKVLLLRSGKVHAVGKPEEVLRPEIIFEVYGVPTIVIKGHKMIAQIF